MADIDLSSLTLDELKKLQKDVNKAVENYEVRRKQEAKPAVEAKAREMGFSLSELTDGTARKGRRPAKYQHPGDTSVTWSGRGRQPGWIKEALENGRSLDEFLLEPKS
jgi:DNA-binding protein H-NS